MNLNIHTSAQYYPGGRCQGIRKLGMASYELIYPCSIQKPTLLDRSDIAIVYSLENNRKSSREAEEIIQQEKTNLLQGNRGLYPGTKFRFDSVTQNAGILELQIGLTDYVDHLVTNHNQQINKILTELGRIRHQNPDAFLSNAIGNLAIVSTIDKNITLLKRSTRVATFQGYYDCPGGHPEPNHVIGEPTAQSISTELFESISREVTEELNLDRGELLSISLIGLIRNLDDGRKPEMIFYIPTSLRPDELRNKYAAGVQTHIEADELLIINAQEALNSSLQLTTPTWLAMNLYTNLEDKPNEYSPAY